MWYFEGRVPRPWRYVQGGPFRSAAEAWAAARESHLGGIRVWCSNRPPKEA